MPLPSPPLPCTWGRSREGMRVNGAATGRGGGGGTRLDSTKGLEHGLPRTHSWDTLRSPLGGGPPSRSLSLPPGCCAQDTSVPAQARALPRNSCSQKNLCPSSENPGFRAIPASPPLQAKGGYFSPQVRVPLLLFVGLGPPGVHGPGCVWPLAALPPSTSFPLVPLTPGRAKGSPALSWPSGFAQRLLGVA